MVTTANYELAEYRIYSECDGLVGHYESPSFVTSVSTEKEAAIHIISNPEHHAVAPNGDILSFDGEGVVREPDCSWTVDEENA